MMSIHDLVFEVNNESVFDPVTLLSDGTPVTFSVTNYGEEALTELGIFLTTTTTLGDVDHPADFPPQTDYQDLLEWGTATDLGLTEEGGLKVTLYDNLANTTYFTRSKGSKLSDKIEFYDLPAGATREFTLTLETPPTVSARRLFVNIVVE